METQLAQDKNPVVDQEVKESPPPPPEHSDNQSTLSASAFKPQSAAGAPPNGAGSLSQTVRFPNGNEARLIHPSQNVTTEAIVATLGLEKPDALMMITPTATNFDDNLKAHLVQLFSRGLIRSAAEIKTIIIDEGQQTDLTAITGQSVADRGYKSVFLGIAPANRVTYPGSPEGEGKQNRVSLEPHHSHLVLVPDGGKWSVADLTVQIAAALAEGKPVVTIVAGGDDSAKAQVVRSVRQGWPVLVIKGSGGLADEIAALWQQRPRPFIADPDMVEIISEGRLYFFGLEDTVQGFQHLLKWLLKPHQTGDQATLELAWNRFGMYDEAANRQQKQFRTVQMWILVLGVVGTLLALIQYTLKHHLVTEGVFDTYYYSTQVLFIILLTVPITISLLITAANRFSAGNKWIALRATAESIKKEIYLYRAHAEAYSAAETTRTSREAKLVRKIDALSSKLMQSEVNVSASQAYNGPIPPKYAVAGGDDGFSFLTPDRYLDYRLQDQLNWYRGKTVKLEKQLYRLQWLIWIFGAIGTFLVAIGFELWIALTTALVGALTTYLEYQQVENTLIRYNQTATDLANIQSWWTALSPAEKADPKNTNKLVGQTETVTHAEHAAWVKEQQDAMAELRAAQAEQSEQSIATHLAGLSAGQVQQVKASFTSLSDFFESSPPTSPQGEEVKETLETLSTLVETNTLSPVRAIQVLDQVTTREELLEAAASQPAKDAQTQDSLSILSALLDNQRLDTAQVQQMLSSLTGLTQLVQAGVLSGGQVEKALGNLSRLSHLVDSGSLSASQLKKALENLPNLSYLVEPGTLSISQIEKALDSLPSLIVMWEKGELSTEPIENVLAILPNLSQWVQRGVLSSIQFERVLVNLSRFARLAQPPEILSPEQVEQLLAAAGRAQSLAAEQARRVLAELPQLIARLKQEDVPPERIDQLIDSLNTLAILLEDKALSEAEIDRVLDSLTLLAAILEERKAMVPLA